MHSSALMLLLPSDQCDLWLTRSNTPTHTHTNKSSDAVPVSRMLNVLLMFSPHAANVMLRTPPVITDGN